METKATFYPQTRRVVADTHIWSHCDFGGFHGTTKVLIVNADGVTLGSATADAKWGVGGKWEHTCCGTLNDRADLDWRVTADIDPADVAAADHIEIGHVHAPENQLANIVNQAGNIISQGIAVARKAAAIWSDIKSLNAANM